MSTTFGIMPTKLDDKLTFGNVISIAEQTMSDFLQTQQMSIKVKLQVEIHDTDEKYIHEADLDDRFLWKEGEYAFFKLENAKTGTDAYCDKISDTLSYWDKYIEDTCGNLVTAAQIQTIKQNDVKWYFRRSAGQAALINIAYGHLAAAVAKLTDGILYADKGWDPENFPTTADDFLKFYFYANKTTYAPGIKWVEKSLNKLRESAVGRKPLV